MRYSHIPKAVSTTARPEALQNRAAALNLVIVAIIFWNTKQIATAVSQLDTRKNLPALIGL